MLNTLFSVADSASSARCHTKLAVAGSSMVAAAGNASTDTSGLLVWNRGTGFMMERLPKHDNVPADEKTMRLGDGGVWVGIGVLRGEDMWDRDGCVSGIDKQVRGN